MSNLPKSIRVGYRDYAVEGWLPALASAAGRWGECDRETLGNQLAQAWRDNPEFIRFMSDSLGGTNG